MFSESMVRIAAAALLLLGLSQTGFSKAFAQERTALDEVIFGKQLSGPAITEEDCRGRVTLFFVWGVT